MNLTMEEALDLCEVTTPARVHGGHISCPFHDENTPSCATWDDHYHCFGCGKGGSAFDFVASYFGVDYRTAAKLISRNIDIEDRPEREAKAPRELPDLTERFRRERNGAMGVSFVDAHNFVKAKWPHLALGQLTDWGVGVGRYNLLIPHYDDGGVVRGVKTRSFTGGGVGRKSALPDSCFTTRLYRVEDKERIGTAVLVEGESDCWTLSHHFGSEPNVTIFALPCGADTWRREWADTLVRHPRVVLFLDADPAGRRGADNVTHALRSARPDIWVKDKIPHAKDVTDAYLAGWRPTL